MCAAWAEQYGVHTSVVRPFHTYGPGMDLDDGRVFADFVRDVVNSHDIELKSDGLARRPFCYIADATVGFLTVLLKGKTAQAYNVAHPEAEISMRDLAYMLTDIFPERKIGVKFSVSDQGNRYLISPIIRQIPSIKKISLLGWAPVTTIRAGFKRTVESYLLNCEE
jgi:nucleoside-diphosphate-sugar epimerase